MLPFSYVIVAILNFLSFILPLNKGLSCLSSFYVKILTAHAISNMSNVFLIFYWKNILYIYDNKVILPAKVLVAIYRTVNWYTNWIHLLPFSRFPYCPIYISNSRIMFTCNTFDILLHIIKKMLQVYKYYNAMSKIFFNAATTICQMAKINKNAVFYAF